MRLWPLLPLLLLLLSSQGLAQQEQADTELGDPPWYRVELMVFANYSDAATGSEQWSPLPTLQYPPASMALAEDSPLRVSAELPFTLVPLEAQLPPLFELFPEESPEALLARYRWEQLTRQPTRTVEPLFSLDVPAAFVPLPSSEHEFRDQHRRLDRARDSKVLFHSAWLQPLRGPERAIPLRVSSTPLRGDFPELQGTVLLYIKRYLHLATNLWLNTDGNYLQSDWVMPSPPLPPEDQPLDMRPFALDIDSGWLDAKTVIADTLTAEEPPETLAPMSTVENIDETGPAPWTESEVADFLAVPYYPFRHAVLLNQSRRMRGGELHYLDHPMLGLLIRVERYEFSPFLGEPEATAPGARQ